MTLYEKMGICIALIAISGPIAFSPSGSISLIAGGVFGLSLGYLFMCIFFK